MKKEKKIRIKKMRNSKEKKSEIKDEKSIKIIIIIRNEGTEIVTNKKT